MLMVALASICPLSYYEHTCSVKPADNIVIFLLVSLSLDLTRLALTMSEAGSLGAPYLVALTMPHKVLLIAVESRGKNSLLVMEERQNLAPEQLAGVLNRLFFWWINSILALGNENALKEDALPPIDAQLSSKRLRRRALLAWDQRGMLLGTLGTH
jgi:ATP-binding cassette, subfamily C (CFTR/MRP), member 1